MKNIESYCYYKIDPEKADIFKVLAEKIFDLYSGRRGCLSYRFSVCLDTERKNTAMESGEFTDLKTFHDLRETIEKQNPEIFGALDAVILGGLKARKYEFFTSLLAS